LTDKFHYLVLVITPSQHHNNLFSEKLTDNSRKLVNNLATLLKSKSQTYHFHSYIIELSIQVYVCMLLSRFMQDIVIFYYTDMYHTSLMY